MEFKEFCRQRDRMCGNMPECSLNKRVGCTRCNIYCFENPDEAERIVSEWAKEHTVVTNADKFREVFRVSIGSFGAPCPDALTIYGIGIISNQEWLEQEYRPPRKEDADD